MEGEWSAQVAVLAFVMMVAVLPLASHPSEAVGDGSYPPPISGDWIISSDTYVQGESLTINGSIIVNPGVQLKLTDVDIEIMPSSNGSNAFRINPDGILDMTRSVIHGRILIYSDSVSITNCEIKTNVYDWCCVYIEGASPILKNNTIQALNDWIGDNAYGVYVVDSNLKLFDNTIAGGNGDSHIHTGGDYDLPAIVPPKYGLCAIYSNIHLTSCTIYGGGEYTISSPDGEHAICSINSAWTIEDTTLIRGLAAEGNSMISFANSTIEPGNQHSMKLRGNTSVMSYNSTFNESNIEVIENATMGIFWPLHVRVLTNDGDRLVNLNVEITWPDYNYTSNFTTDLYGWTPPIPSLECAYNESGCIYQSTYLVTARKGVVVVNEMVNVTNETYITLTLNISLPDTSSPVTIATINGVNGDSGWYVSTVMVSLTASDWWSGINRTYYRIDYGDWQEYSGGFQVTKEGTTVLDYYSIDLSGIEEESHREQILIDTMIPSVSMFSDTWDGKSDDYELWINFSEPMNTTSVDDSFSVEGHFTVSEIEWLPGNSTMIIRGESDGKEGTQYSLSVDRTAKDVAGNQLDFAWSTSCVVTSSDSWDITPYGVWLGIVGIVIFVSLVIFLLVRK